MAVAAVMGLAIGNGAGRIIAGFLSDKIGRNKTLFLFFLIQAGAIFGLSVASTQDTPSAVLLVIIAAVVGANYGSNLSLFPSMTKDYFGLKNFGVNYGFVFTAWGVGGFCLALLAGKVYDSTHSYKFAFMTSIVLLIIAGIMVFCVKPPHHSVESGEPAEE